MVSEGQKGEGIMAVPSGTLTDRGTEIPPELIKKWATAAAAQALVEPMEAPNGYYAEVAETPGAWGYGQTEDCLLYTSPSPRDGLLSRMPSSA